MNDASIDDAGRRLDAHHPAEPTPESVVNYCERCRFSIDDSLGRSPFHRPTLAELSRVQRWLATFSPDYGNDGA